MNALDHPLTQDYLRRLHAETVRLRVPERRELETQIREHLEEALGPEPAEAQIRETLDRLGDPAELVDEAGGAPAPPGVVTAASATQDMSAEPTAWREVGALVALVGAGLLFWFFPINLLLWVGGLVLLVMATRWTVGEKLWGALVLGVSPWAVILAARTTFTVSEQTCSVTADGARMCTGGDEGLSALNVVAIVLTALWLGLYLWTLVRLARAAR